VKRTGHAGRLTKELTRLSICNVTRRCYTTVLNSSCDPKSVWPQATAECLAASIMTGSSGHTIPCFAGDLNRHIIVHLAEENGRDVHIARHQNTQQGKAMALSYMRHLQQQGLVRLTQASPGITLRLVLSITLRLACLRKSMLLS
jgi:hypothetical protein